MSAAARGDGHGRHRTSTGAGAVRRGRRRRRRSERGRGGRSPALRAGPSADRASSRSYASIVRANVLTVFNAILAAFGAVTLLFGDARDALFLGIIVANATIGITQEVARQARARPASRRSSRRARSWCATASARELATGEVVRATSCALRAGDQIVADGELVAAQRAAARRVGADRRVRAGARARRARASARARSSSRGAASFSVDRRRRATASPSGWPARRARSATRARRSNGPSTGCCTRSSRWSSCSARCSATRCTTGTRRCTRPWRPRPPAS